MLISSPVKSSDTPSEPSRSYLPRLFDAPPPEEKDERLEKFVPRYVDLPAIRDRGNGPRNLAWGVVTFLLAFMLLALAVFFSGAKAALALATCLLTFAALFVLARLHLFRQRNGGFLALSVVCLLGALVALSERAFVAADALLKKQSVSTSSPSASRPPEMDTPLLTQSFALSAPDARRRQVKVLKDSRVVIAEKPFAIKAGDLFPLLETKADQTTFAVRDLRVALPTSVVEILEPGAEVKKSSTASDGPLPENKTKASPSSSKPAGASVPSLATANDDPAKREFDRLTLIAQKEAILRYPALGVKDSRENRLFVATYNQKKNTGDEEFLSHPDWPILLADELAKSEGWSRDSQTMAGAPSLTDGARIARPSVDPDTLPPDDTPSILPKPDALPR